MSDPTGPAAGRAPERGIPDWAEQAAAAQVDADPAAPILEGDAYVAEAPEAV